MSEDTLHHVIRRNVHDSAHPDGRNAPMKFKGRFVVWGDDGHVRYQAPPCIRPTFFLTGEKEGAYRKGFYHTGEADSCGDY